MILLKTNKIHLKGSAPVFILAYQYNNHEFFQTHCSSFPTKPRSSTTYSILFTQTKPDPFIKVIPQLGGCIVDTPQLGNILICDKVSHTFKFLYALAKGIPIVSPRWLEKSAKYGEFQSTEPYLLNDKKAEAKYAFSLRRSLGNLQIFIYFYVKSK